MTWVESIHDLDEVECMDETKTFKWPWMTWMKFTTINNRNWIMGLNFIKWMKLIKQKIVMKMDETQQCQWNREIKGHKLKVNDISEGCCCAYYVSKLYKIVFLSFKSHGYQLYNVHTHSSCLGQKWQKNTFRPKKHFSWPMKWGSMHPFGLGFVFWGRVMVLAFVVPNVFPTCFQ